MSNISTIFDAVGTFLGATYPSHKTMVNPYDVTLNDNFILNQGVGFLIGPAINSKKFLDCKISVQRELIIKLTRVQRGTDRDYDIRQTAEKLLLEDQFTLIKELEKDPTINDLVSQLSWESDGGIEFVYPDKINYLLIESRFLLEYFEEH